MLDRVEKHGKRILLFCAFTVGIFLLGFETGRWNGRMTPSAKAPISAEVSPQPDQRFDKTGTAGKTEINPEDEDAVSNYQGRDVTTESSMETVREETVDLNIGEDQPESAGKQFSSSGQNREDDFPSSSQGKENQDFQEGQTAEIQNSPVKKDAENVSSSLSQEAEKRMETELAAYRECVQTLSRRSETMNDQLNQLYSGLSMTKMGMQSLTGSTDRILRQMESLRNSTKIGGQEEFSEESDALEILSGGVRQIDKSLQTMFGQDGMGSMIGLTMEIQDENNENLLLMKGLEGEADEGKLMSQ